MKASEASKIKFKNVSSGFYAELKTEVGTLLSAAVLKKANRIMLFKFVFYALLYVVLYAGIYTSWVSTDFRWLVLNYILFGLTCILLAFNCAHDCVHNTFTRNKKINFTVFYLVFNLQGVNAKLWHKRHLASHHIFPNVDGCDADIDDNPFMRLSPHQQWKKHHKYQHVYALFLYLLYTLHWVLIKDIIYLNKKKLANLNNQTYSSAFITEVVVLKLLYITLLIVLPAVFSQATLVQLLVAFLIMHAVMSFFFVLTLIISHLCLETVFPKVDAAGRLPYDYYEHQLAVSLDYHPESRLANFVFGGFNSHTAHHLFPNLQHTVYTAITPLIREKARKYNLPYNEKSILKAIRSHFYYLKKLGEA